MKIQIKYNNLIEKLKSILNQYPSKYQTKVKMKQVRIKQVKIHHRNLENKYNQVHQVKIQTKYNNLIEKLKLDLNQYPFQYQMKVKMNQVDIHQQIKYLLINKLINQVKNHQIKVLNQMKILE